MTMSVDDFLMTLTLSKSNVMYVHGDSMGDDMQYIPHLINNSVALYACTCTCTCRCVDAAQVPLPSLC